MNLSGTIRSIQDIMRKDDGVDGDAQRLGQLTWMLFLKVFDQREEEWREADAFYNSPLPPRMRWKDWAVASSGTGGLGAPRIPASDIISFVNNDLFPALKSIDPERSPRHKVVRGVFEDANNYMKSGTQFLAVIDRLEEAINFRDFTTRSNLGDVYEQLLNDLRGAGNAGEFYTPRAITRFMVDRVNPRLRKGTGEVSLDPACGTGGFLTAVIDHLTNQLGKKAKASGRIIDNLVRGIEKKQLPHLLCTTNMLLHGIDVPSQIEHRNTLARSWHEWSESDKVDCVVTNPPFGGYEDDDVGSDFPAQFRTRETADMFIALIVEKLLKQNGRAAVVLPDGFLFGDGVKATVKQRLLRTCRLHTIVRLPKGVFAPYTTIKTNILFFTKSAKSAESADFATDTIWYYEHPYPAGYRSYSKTKPIAYDEFKPEQEWWGTEKNDFAERAETEFAWKLDFKARWSQVDALARPHKDRAEELLAESLKADADARDLRESIKPADKAKQRQIIESGAEQLREKAEALRQRMREERSIAERHYSSAFNLDMANPNARKDDDDSVDVLLGRYMALVAQIEEVEGVLKSELSSALAHHLPDDEA